MENILKPAVGSNQHLTRFDEKIKGKKKKFKITLRTKIEITGLIALILLGYSVIYLLKDNYVLTCTPVIGGIEQSTWGHYGHFMKQSTCDEIVQDHLQANSNQNAQ